MMRYEAWVLKEFSFQRGKRQLNGSGHLVKGNIRQFLHEACAFLHFRKSSRSIHHRTALV